MACLTTGSSFAQDYPEESAADTVSTESAAFLTNTFDKQQWKSIVRKLNYTVKDSAKLEKERRNKLKEFSDKKAQLDSLNIENSLLDSLKQKDWQDIKEADNEAADSLSFYLDESKEGYFDEEWKEDFEELKKLEQRKVVRKSWSFPDFMAGFIKVLLYGMAIALLAFLIYKVLEKHLFVKNKKTKQKSLSDEKTVEEIESIDELEQLYNEAVKSGNYRLAVRIQYLMIIRELSQQNLIVWKKDKTNREYIREMRKSNSFDAFREITNLFERIWYGHFDINKATFEKISPRFRDFVTTIK